MRQSVIQRLQPCDFLVDGRHALDIRRRGLAEVQRCLALAAEFGEAEGAVLLYHSKSRPKPMGFGVRIIGLPSGQTSPVSMAR